MKGLLKNAVDSAGNSVDIAFASGRIVSPEKVDKEFQVVDAGGLTVIPGLVDLHTHLREPGKEDAETVLSGSKAAVAGGFTAISAMHS